MNKPWRIHVSPVISSPGVPEGCSQPPGGGGTSYGHAVTAILNASGEVICQDADYYSDAPSVAEMAHIVNCVNAHDDLVAALRQCLTELEAYDEGSADPLDPHHVAIREARAALAKAGEP